MTTETQPQHAIESIEVRKVIEIAAPIDIAFEAMLEEIGPETQTMDGTPMPLKLEPWPGGRWYRDLGNNAGHLWGIVQVIKPPILLEICGPLMMSYPAVNHVQYRFICTGQRNAIDVSRIGAWDGLPLSIARGCPRVGAAHWADKIRQ